MAVRRERRYVRLFVMKMTDADGEASETQVSLDFSFNCGYLGAKKYEELSEGYDTLGRMLGTLIAKPFKFTR